MMLSMRVSNIRFFKSEIFNLLSILTCFQSTDHGNTQRDIGIDTGIGERDVIVCVCSALTEKK